MMHPLHNREIAKTPGTVSMATAQAALLPVMMGPALEKNSQCTYPVN